MLKAKITSSLTSATVNEKKNKLIFFLVPNIAEDIEKQFWPPAWQ